MRGLPGVNPSAQRDRPPFLVKERGTRGERRRSPVKKREGVRGYAEEGELLKGTLNIPEKITSRRDGAAPGELREPLKH